MGKLEILGLEQVRFRQGKSILDHYITLSNVINKYVKTKSKLYVSFLDLKAAFNSVDHEIVG